MLAEYGEDSAATPAPDSRGLSLVERPGGHEERGHRTSSSDGAGKQVGRRVALAAEGRRLTGFRFHHLRHTVVTDLLEAGEPEHVIEAITGHLSRRMPEH